MTMAPLLYIAAFLAIALGVAHSVLGERFILVRLFRRSDLPSLFGSPRFTIQTLRFAWHLTTVAWFGFGAMLLHAGRGDLTIPGMLKVIGVTFVVSGLLPLVFTRGRHLAWLVLFAIGALAFWSGTSAAGPASAGNTAYIEFLWKPAPEGALARAQAFGFVLDEGQDHRVCVAAIDFVARPGVLRIDVVDASGGTVHTQDHEHFTGTKECYPVHLPTSATPGEWRFNVYLDDTLVATKTIEVSRTLEEASFHADPSRPYVLGRPNYDPDIPPGEYVGRLSWIMSVDPHGVVRHVEVEAAEGAGELMKDRAIAAGFLTVFPPNPSPAAKPFKVRQEYLLDTD